MPQAWQRPTVDTSFHIDLKWWENQGRDIRILIRELLCDECKEAYSGPVSELADVDWVDEETGQVARVDALWHALRTCCGSRPDFVSPSTPIVEAVFRTFLANGNRPLSIRELHGLIDRRPPQTLLRMLTGGQIYLGIRPVRQ
jgi:hypothetical protein